MQAHWVDNDKLLIPVRAVAEDGTLGDGAVVIGPDDPRYEEWAAVTPRPDRS